jgi:transcriptional regulator with XRE-family HTH domain
MPRNTPAYEGEKKDFPSILRKLMEEDFKAKNGKKDTQADLAEAIGVQRQTISGYLNGLSSPDWEKLVKIANRYDVSVSYLVGQFGDSKLKPVATEELGLPEKAIDQLKDIKKLADREEAPETYFQKRFELLRTLLSDKRFEKSLNHFTNIYWAAEKTRAEKKKKAAGEEYEARALYDYKLEKFLCLEELGKLIVSICHTEDLED